MRYIIQAYKPHDLDAPASRRVVVSLEELAAWLVDYSNGGYLCRVIEVHD